MKLRVNAENGSFDTDISHGNEANHVEEKDQAFADEHGGVSESRQWVAGKQVRDRTTQPLPAPGCLYWLDEKDWQAAVKEWSSRPR